MTAGTRLAQETFNRALDLHRRSRASEARELYEKALQLDPDLVGAWVMLGVIALEAQLPEQAIALSERAVANDPHNLAAHLVRGHAELRMSRHESAAASYGKVIEIDPRHAEAHFHRGDALRGAGRYRAAVDSYDRAIALKPGVAAMHFNRGMALRDLGQIMDGAREFRTAASLDPQLAAAHFELGNGMWQLGDREAALAAYDLAVKTRTDFADAHLNRGNVLRELQRYEEALASYDRAIASDANQVFAHGNRGNVLAELGRIDAALASYDRAIAVSPGRPEAYSNRADLLQRLGQWDAALAGYDAALERDPTFAAAHQNRSYALLIRGNFDRGWIEHEWRWKNEHGSLVRAARNFAQSLWLGGENLTGRTVLLHAEQGLGDTLQFCRYAKFVADMGATVVLEVPRQLTTLLRGLDGVSQVVARGDALPPFDLHCPLMSLPLAFKTTLETVPGTVPYVRADAAQRLAWQQRLGERRGPRVGLVWSGGFRPEHPELWSVNGRRNIPLARLAPLAGSDVDFYTLQKGACAEAELADLKSKHWSGPHLIDWTSLLADFSDTAALIANLDLVITVDTAVAHLAGALGKPVWIMSRFDGCWRWLLDRVDSPWYPTAKLYRQSRPGDWGSLVERLCADLARFAP